MSELKRFTVEFLKALADPIRLDILHLLEKSKLNSSELQEELGRSQSTISKHLNMLFENNLIDFEKKNKVNYYTIKNSEIIELINNITAIVLNTNRKRLKDLQKKDIEDVLSP
ncbi:MAG: winged helix-turn-helix transcriptional regulator [Candidatus Lokiarchaeota archaeon]|nr:winged helix-turn-helix transcriptional regulator [Candidatus Lokiarchaeota archaeon]